MKLIYRYICLIYNISFSLYEDIFLKKKKVNNSDVYTFFKNIDFKLIDITSFETKGNKYLERVVFPEKDIIDIINDLFIKNDLMNKITNLTGFKYSINFFTAYKTYKLDDEDRSKNVYANHFHKDKPYSKNMIKLIFSYQEISENDGPMEILDSSIIKVCLKKNEIFLFYPNKINHRATSPNNGQRFQIMFQLSPSVEWKYNCNIFHKQMYREPKFPFFSYLFDKKKLINYD
jgi:hypothetical protein